MRSRVSAKALPQAEDLLADGHRVVQHRGLGDLLFTAPGASVNFRLWPGIFKRKVLSFKGQGPGLVNVLWVEAQTDAWSTVSTIPGPGP